MKRSLAIIALCLAGCPAQVSLECTRCSSDDECAPQGLTCVAGRCGACDGGGGSGGGGRGGGGGQSGGGQGGAGGSGGAFDGGFDAGWAGTLPPLGAVRDASVALQDDFEGALLTSDGGKWDRIEKDDAPGQTLGIVAGAGRSGGGLVLNDTSATNGAAEYGKFVAQDLADLTGEVYVRVQVWLSAVDRLGPHPVTVYSGQVQASVAGELVTRGDIIFQSADVSDVTSCQIAGLWGLDAWHQVDLVFQRMGSSGATGTLRVDGTRCAVSRNWSGAKIGAVALGATAMDNRWVGQLKHDNFALTVSGPAPGRLSWVLPVAPAAGRCAPLRLQLEDTFDGGLAKAVRPVRVAVDAGTAGLYAADCTGPALGEVTVPAGEVAVLLSVRAASGTVSLSASDLGADLAPAAAALTVP
ncbi:MAG: hypothetical protein IPJ65_15650 [Archangiaceae bacterium]|nr:hypothetical protein [Archangiaceae bacterium]